MEYRIVDLSAPAGAGIEITFARIYFILQDTGQYSILSPERIAYYMPVKTLFVGDAESMDLAKRMSIKQAEFLLKTSERIVFNLNANGMVRRWYWVKGVGVVRVENENSKSFESGDIVAIKTDKCGWVTAVCQVPSDKDGGPVFYSLQIAAESDYIGIFEGEANSPFISPGEFSDVVLLEKGSK